MRLAGDVELFAGFSLPAMVGIHLDAEAHAALWLRVAWVPSTLAQIAQAVLAMAASTGVKRVGVFDEVAQMAVVVVTDRCFRWRSALADLA